MRKLPSGCICDDSFRSKKMRYIESAIRELKLIKKIYETDGKWKPKVMMNGEFIDENTVEVKEHDNGARILFPIPLDKKEVEIILFDAEDKPLYRKIIKVDKNKITIVGEDTNIDTNEIELNEYELMISWNVGWRIE